MTDNNAITFRALHRPGDPLVLVNVWDVASARIVAAAGARAIASTSAGASWNLGLPDGDTLDRVAVVHLAASITAAVDLPFSADIESGYGATPQDVASTGRALADAGAVGVNIEDGPRDIADACARIAALADLDLFVNARIDTYLRGLGGLMETLARARAYIDAGADGVFVPGVVDPATIAALVRGLPVPINVMAGPGAPSVAVLADLGVARVSLGSSVAQAAYGVARRAADEAFAAGTYTALDGGLDYQALNALMLT